jgi:eukaryotic-like serine/threonine-protein kinase
MPLTVGTRLGQYEILAPLGAGGMGEVYKARDPRLNRAIAIKILPQTTAADPEVRARFEREAQSVAALNHPNIVTIHSVEEADSLLFLTMELVEGRPVSEAMVTGGLPLELILKLAIQLADAVSAAHERGVTHRDLKPANVMVTPDGRVKVLDFGLAKLKESQPGHAALTAMSAAPTRPLTSQGQIVGTVAYMSPEQAEGKAVDHRSDLFSLGIILYEMATGERPFRGDSNLSLLSAILRDTPRAVTEINRALPRELGRIIRHCLAKDPARRYQTAADLRNELAELKQDLDSGDMSAGSTQQSPVVPVVSVTSGLRGRWLPAAAAFVALAVVVAAAVFVVRALRQGEESSQAPAARVEAAFTRLTAQPGVEQFPSLSPDGGWIVYSSGEPGSEDIFLRSVGGQTPINLTKDSTESDTEPAFSPDGERIAFRSERQGGGIFVMGRTGDSPRRLTEDGFNPAWSPDGNNVLYATENVVDPFDRESISQLWKVNVATGAKTRVSEGDAVQPRWSPHNYRIAYWTLDTAAGGGQRDIYTMPSGGGEALPVTSDAALDWNPVWSPDGKYLYFSSNRGGSLNLWRVAIDERSGKTLGQPEPITTPSPYVAHLSFSADGQRLVYASLVLTSNIQRAAFDPATETFKGELTWVTRGSKFWIGAELSPDGEWLAFASSREQEDIFISRSDSLRQLTNDLANDRFPRWSPDGKRIAFYSTRSGNYQIWLIDPDGSGLQQVTEYAEGLTDPVWSSDGARIAANDLYSNRVFIFEPGKPWKDQMPQPLPPPPAGESFTANSWSPDGRWLAGQDRPHPGHPRGGIVIYSLQSQTYERLTDFAGLFQGSVWLSDSRRLLFGFQGKLFLVDSQSKKVHEVLSVPGETLTGPGLSRDNRQIYFTRGTNEADIWMATLK